MNFKQRFSSLKILDWIQDAGASKITFNVVKNFKTNLLLLSSFVYCRNIRANTRALLM